MWFYLGRRLAERRSFLVSLLIFTIAVTKLRLATVILMAKAANVNTTSISLTPFFLEGVFIVPQNRTNVLVMTKKSWTFHNRKAQHIYLLFFKLEDF